MYNLKYISECIITIQGQSLQLLGPHSLLLNEEVKKMLDLGSRRIVWDKLYTSGTHHNINTPLCV